MLQNLGNYITTIWNAFFAKDEGARTLQVAGMLRFGLIFIQGIILVKAGVPIPVIGEIGLVFFLANFLMYYFQNGGRNALLSWVNKTGEATTLKQRLGTVFIAMQVFGLISALLMFLFSLFPVKDTYSFLSEGNNVIYLMVYIFFTVPVGPLIYNYLMTERHRRIYWFVAVSYIFQISVVLVPMLLNWGLNSMLFGLSIFAIVRWAFALIDGKWFSDGLPTKKLLYTFIVFSLPLVLHALNGGLMDYIDGWIVSWYFGKEQFALYTYGAKEFPVNALLIGGLLTGMIPLFNKSGSVDNAVLKLEISRLIRILLPINCLLILISPWLYTLVYSAEFTVSARIFNIYALTLLSRIVINQVYLYVMHRNWVLALSTIGEVILNVILSLLLLQSMGLIGIPLATVIAYAVHKLFLIAYIQIDMKQPVQTYLPVRQYGLALIVMCGCFFIAELIYF